MQKSDFEKNIAQKMEELKFVPSEAVWNRVEAELPKEKRRKPFILSLFFIAALLAGLFVWNKFDGKKQNKNIAQQENKKTTTQNNNLTKNEIESNKNVADSNSIVANKTNAATNKTSTNEQLSKEEIKDNKKTTQNSGLKIAATKPKQQESILVNEKVDNELAAVRKKRIATKSKTTIKTKTPTVSNDDDDNAVVNKTDMDIDKKQIDNAVNEAAKSIDTTIVAITKTEKDTAVAVKKDTALVKEQPTKQQKEKTKWRFGMDGGAGLSTVKANLFGSSIVYADVLYYAAPTNIGNAPPITTVTFVQLKPASNLAVNLGAYAEKQLNNHWKFKTGFNYFYQSNTIKVGERVDSSITSAANRNLTAPQYYRTGNSNTYKNKFHLLEIPVLMDFRFTKKSAFHVEAGPTVAYLLYSNAVLYNKTSAAYFTHKDLFNKLILSFNAGASIDLAKKTKLPFSIGYRFKYGINSVIKTTYADQHFVSSLLYVKIPFKK